MNQSKQSNSSAASAKTLSDDATPHELSTTSIKPVAFVQALWHEDIVNQCFTGFSNYWQAQHMDMQLVERYRVPGSFDIPLLAKRLAASQRYSAIVASGLVVDGGIYRHDFVASTVVDALMQIQLTTDVPVVSAVLTPHQFQEHEQHMRFFHDHFVVKGEEAARACLHILTNFTRLSRSAA